MSTQIRKLSWISNRDEHRIELMETPPKAYPSDIRVCCIGHATLDQFKVL